MSDAASYQTSYIVLDHGPIGARYSKPKQVGNFYASRERAKSRADKLDAAYGGCRYSVESR